jgi:ADP-ribosyl-[dinitrogen reductase] hydrolase
MPKAKMRLEVDQTFSQEEYECLQLGRIPQSMDDKWFIYCEDGWLFLHRSWSGLCIYQVHLEPSDEGWKIVEVRVNDDASQNRLETPLVELLALLGDLASRKPVRERYRGSLLGLAVGDAVGTTLEFMQPGSFAPLDDMVGGGPFHLHPGEWTDDTSMTLCLAASLVERKCFDARDQMERYLRWRNAGYMSSTGRCFDIGGTVSSSLRRFEQTGNPFAGSHDPHTAGNGSIMRLTPVPLFYPHNPREAIEKAAESSRTTHGAPTAVDACRYLAALIVGAVHGASKEELLSAYFSPIPNYWQQSPLVPEIDEIAAGSFKQRQPPEIRGTGYVVKSLEAALWAFYQSNSFREGCLLAVNLGDDADTTGAVYGQLAGAFYGEQGIPQEWRTRLAHRSPIESHADQLLLCSW